MIILLSTEKNQSWCLFPRALAMGTIRGYFLFTISENNTNDENLAGSEYNWIVKCFSYRNCWLHFSADALIEWHIFFATFFFLLSFYSGIKSLIAAKCVRKKQKSISINQLHIHVRSFSLIINISIRRSTYHRKSVVQVIHHRR